MIPMRPGNPFQHRSRGRWNGSFENAEGIVVFRPQLRRQVILDKFSDY